MGCAREKQARPGTAAGRHGRGWSDCELGAPEQRLGIWRRWMIRMAAAGGRRDGDDEVDEQDNSSACFLLLLAAAARYSTAAVTTTATTTTLCPATAHGATAPAAARVSRWARASRLWPLQALAGVGRAVAGKRGRGKKGQVLASRARQTAEQPTSCWSDDGASAMVGKRAFTFVDLRPPGRSTPKRA